MENKLTLENKNFKSKLDSSIIKIYINYTQLIDEYIVCFKKNIKITNKNHSIFIYS